MRFFTSLILSLCAAAVAVAQSSNSTSANAFTLTTYSVTAGQTFTLQWSNPVGSTVTIKLQQSGSSITPTSGLVLASSIQNTGSTTVTVPSGSSLPAGQYTFEIINDSDATQYNFSPNFSISGASASGSLSSGTASAASTASGSSNSSSSSMSTTASGFSNMTMTTSGTGTSSTSTFNPNTTPTTTRGVAQSTGTSVSTTATGAASAIAKAPFTVALVGLTCVLVGAATLL